MTQKIIISLLFIFGFQVIGKSQKDGLFFSLDSANKYPTQVITLYLEEKTVYERDFLNYINLQSIHLVHCYNMDNFFKFAYKFNKLETVIIEWHLTYLNKNIQRCNKLKHLYIFASPINKIPKFISKLDSLRSLHINYCDITKIPSSIYKMKSLKSLMISNGDIEFNLLSKKEQNKIKKRMKKRNPDCVVRF